MIAQAAGEIDVAVDLLRDAVAYHRREKAGGFVAWDCLWCADALIERDGADDCREAQALLNEGREIASKQGRVLLLQRIDQLAARLPPGTRRDETTGLTHRQVEVLRLVAAGRTDKEIGQLLFIATGTVTNHVRAICNKTGCVNRAEAAAFAVRTGLTEDAS